MSAGTAGFPVSPAGALIAAVVATFVVASLDVHVGALLAQLGADLLGVGHSLLADPHVLDRHRLLLDDGAFLTQRDLLDLFAGVPDRGFGGVTGGWRALDDELSLVTGTSTFSVWVVVYLRSRARPTSTRSLPAFSRSSDSVMACSLSPASAALGRLRSLSVQSGVDPGLPASPISPRLPKP